MHKKQILMATYTTTLNPKPQTHETNPNRFPTLATAYPQGVRQLQPPRQKRNHQALVRQLDTARSHPSSEKRLSHGMDTPYPEHHARLYGGGIHRPARWQLRRGMA